MMILQSLYEARWLFLIFLIVAGIGAHTCHPRATRVVLRQFVYVHFLLVTIYILVPTAHRDVLLDLAVRVSLLLQSAELLWIEMGNDPKEEIKLPGEKGAKFSQASSSFPRTYKMRVVYAITTIFSLAWLLLGLTFAPF